MSFKQFFNEARALMHPMGSGTQLSTDGSVSITPKERKLYSNATKDSYFESLSKLVEYVVAGLEKAGLKAIHGNEEWIGSFTGAMSDRQDASFKFDLVKDGKAVKNSKLILNIFREDRYELNSYLS